MVISLYDVFRDVDESLLKSYNIGKIIENIINIWLLSWLTLSSEKIKNDIMKAVSSPHEELIQKYSSKKTQEFRDVYWSDYILSNSITQEFKSKKESEKKQKEEEIKKQEILEKEKEAKPMEYSAKKTVDVSSLPRSVLLKYGVDIGTWRQIDDLYGMAQVDWETMRKIWLDRNTDWYGRAIYMYAERWAKLMQIEIEKWAKLQDIAGKISHDVDIEGISWFMYWAAVSLLVSCRKYGEELKKRHNKEYNYEWDWVVNPAVINVSVK